MAELNWGKQGEPSETAAIHNGTQGGNSHSTNEGALRIDLDLEHRAQPPRSRQQRMATTSSLNLIGHSRQVTDHPRPIEPEDQYCGTPSCGGSA